MKSNLVVGTAVLAAFVPILGSNAQAGMIKCHLKYSLEGWSVFYESATGEGTITCDNGQTVPVVLRAKGGGLTAGKVSIDDGIGEISAVSDIDEIFGRYASAEANAGAGDAASARVVTKGPVSIALSGKGDGINLGWSFGEFVIERAPTKKSR
jgi:hypothetical protein